MKFYLANSTMTLATMATCVSSLLLSATVVDGAGWKNRFLRIPAAVPADADRESVSTTIVAESNHRHLQADPLPRSARTDTEERFVTPTESPTQVSIVSMAPTASLAPTIIKPMDSRTVQIVHPPFGVSATEVADDMEITSTTMMNEQCADDPRRCRYVTEENDLGQRGGGNRDRNLRDGSITMNFDGNDYDHDNDDSTFDVVHTHSHSSRFLKSRFSDDFGNDFDLTVDCTFVAPEDETSSESSSEPTNMAPSFEPSQSPSSPSNDSPSASPTNTFSCVTTLISLPAKGGNVEGDSQQQCLDYQTDYLRSELPMMLTKSLDYLIEFDSNNIVNTRSYMNINPPACNSISEAFADIERTSIGLMNERCAEDPRRCGENPAKNPTKSPSQSKSDDSNSADSTSYSTNESPTESPTTNTPTESPSRVSTLAPTVTLAPTATLAPTKFMPLDTYTVMTVSPPLGRNTSDVEDDIKRESHRERFTPAPQQFDSNSAESKSDSTSNSKSDSKSAD